jgi:CsoR family transcriptional regulator, copper-sensing transcriptional repressor
MEIQTEKQPHHPDHSASKKRLNRIRGQIEAISRMIDERQYCLDIVQQIRAATSALSSLEQEILKGHLQGCVKKAMTAKDPAEIQRRIEEIIKLWK